MRLRHDKPRAKRWTDIRQMMNDHRVLMRRPWFSKSTDPVLQVNDIAIIIPRYLANNVLKYGYVDFPIDKQERIAVWQNPGNNFLLNEPWLKHAMQVHNIPARIWNSEMFPFTGGMKPGPSYGACKAALEATLLVEASAGDKSSEN